MNMRSWLFISANHDTETWGLFQCRSSFLCPYSLKRRGLTDLGITWRPSQVYNGNLYTSKMKSSWWLPIWHIITSKRCHCDVITSKWRHFDVITTPLLPNVSVGIGARVYELPSQRKDNVGFTLRAVSIWSFTFTISSYPGQSSLWNC